jgi:hypothetical protein
MKKIFAFFVILLTASAAVSGQNKSQLVTDKYDRSSLTLILIDQPGFDYTTKLREGITKIQVPEKYFENKIDLKTINVPRAASAVGALGVAGADINKIREVLNREKTGNKIISYWYARQADGTMSADRFLERGMYNATDADVLKAKGTKRGVDAIKDFGDKLIRQSYAVVLDYPNLKAINEEKIRGWSSDAKLYLFKVIFDDAIQAKLYNELWIYPEDSPDVKAKKKLAFDQMNFDLEFVSQAGATLSQSELKNPPANYRITLTNDELFDVLLQQGLDDCIYKVEKNVEEMKVKTALYQVNPLKAKVGKKEGLAVDHRYFVYEYVYHEKTNTTTSVRRSVLRVKKVADNRNIATGESQMSTFYQVAGGHLEKGFTLQQRNDAGIGVYLGNEFGNVGGISARIEANAGRIASVPSLYVFIGAGMQKKTYANVPDKDGLFITPNLQDLTFLHYEIGVAKGIRLIKILELAPYGSFGYEEARNKDWKDDVQFNGNVIKSMYVKYGANLSLNLRYNIQLVGGVGGYLFLYAEDSKDELLIGGEKKNYDYFFPDRGWKKAFSNFVGIRFQF